jgi:hypothetical protein
MRQLELFDRQLERFDLPVTREIRVSPRPVEFETPIAHEREHAARLRRPEEEEPERWDGLS